ncbi:MAG: DeoR/GlpR transcriptional regulator, partial [Rhodobacteraceae bacterium]
MWHEERRSRIVTLLKDGARASTSTIAAELGVSRETVRRDLLTLEAEGLLQRVHGGAIAPRDAGEAPFERRRRQRWREKLAIGRAAARLIEAGMIVFVDAGTTTLAFAETLEARRDIRVVTNSIGVAQRLGDRAILLGGAVTSDVPATFGELTLSEIDRFMADLTFISPVAVHPEDGAMNYALHEAEVARAMIRRSRRLVVLADRSKLDVKSRVTVCKPSEINVLVTDGKPSHCVAEAVISA